MFSQCGCPDSRSKSGDSRCNHGEDDFDHHCLQQSAIPVPVVEQHFVEMVRMTASSRSMRRQRSKDWTVGLFTDWSEETNVSVMVCALSICKPRPRMVKLCDACQAHSGYGLSSSFLIDVVRAVLAAEEGKLGKSGTGP